MTEPTGGRDWLTKAGETALDLFTESLITVRHISYEITQYFVSGNPPKSLVDRLTNTALTTNGTVCSVLNALFHQAEFCQTQYNSVKFKAPSQRVVSAIRAIVIYSPQLRAAFILGSPEFMYK
ncbi:MAG: DUF1800 domain-containing protein [Stenomitos rutilans HA7619-LM2]|jgi:uncharacterized protein (DUF1800 family)|nr:DUF1800 domain-containing protein [Stenomitos rutilans HA7619-LM2]